MKKISTLILSLCLLSSVSFGQYYYLAGGTGNPGGLNTDDEFPLGGGLAATWTSILGPSVATPTWSANQTIPFTFNFNASPVTGYKVSSTGVLTFTTGATTAPTATNAILPSASIPDASVCVWGLTLPGTNDNVVIKTFGTSPNRQQWVTWSSSSLGGGSSWSYWAIVLEETTNNIYVVDQRHSGTSGGITIGVQVDATTAVNVLGSPSVLPQAGTNQTPADNVYYTFIQGTQSANDAALSSLNTLPYAAAGNLNIEGVVKNLGSNAITAMDITWNDGSGPQVDNLTGLNIPTNGTYNFTHSTPLTVVAGSAYNLTVEVTLAGDANIANNTLTTSTVGLSQIPNKVVVGEEKTGTWCGFCPRGAVGLAGMESNPDFIGIAVHNADPMTISAYDAGTATYHPDFTGYPHGAVDRVIGGDPSDFNIMHPQRVTDVVPCEVKNIVAVYDAPSGQISVSADAEFFGNINGDYRMSCVITEDDIATTGSGWNQVNYYAGGSYGPLTDPVSGFNWVTAGSSVSPLAFGGYDHVAVSLSNNDILGDAGSLPAGTATVGVHSYTFADVPTSLVGDPNKAHAVVMVVNAATAEIMNAAIVPLTVIISTNDIESAFNLNVYPNPTSDAATISLELKENTEVSIEIYNSLGKKVQSKQATKLAIGEHTITFDMSALSSGIYFAKLNIGNASVTKKIQKN